jgi:hypothetical protein
VVQQDLAQLVGAPRRRRASGAAGSDAAPREPMRVS